jgi:hypothetical protein
VPADPIYFDCFVLREYLRYSRVEDLKRMWELFSTRSKFDLSWGTIPAIEVVCADGSGVSNDSPPLFGANEV